MSTRALATVSVEGWESFLGLDAILQGTAWLVFLLASVRLMQGPLRWSGMCLVVGFALSLLILLYREAVQWGWLQMDYWPGAGAAEFESGGPEVQVRWWEPLLWWSAWAAAFAGKGLVAFGFFTAARRMVRDARFGTKGRRSRA